MDFSYRAADPRIGSALRDLKREVAALLASHIEDRQLGEATVILDMSPGLAARVSRLRNAKRFRTRDTAP